MRFSIGKPNQREYHACRDLQGEHIWCCNAALVQAAQTESPGSPQPSPLALGKPSRTRDLRGIPNLTTNPRPQAAAGASGVGLARPPHPGTASAAPRLSTDAPVKATGTATS